MADRDWRIDTLKALGAPLTLANLKFLSDWQRREGGHTANSATWNYLNSTSGSQYPAINSEGVRKYPDYTTGIRYTVSTLNNGLYTSVVRGLKSGNPYSPTLRQGVLGDLSTWVSGTRAGNLGYAASVLGTPSFHLASGGQPSFEEAKDIPGARQGGPFGAQIGAASGAVSGVIDTITSIPKLIAWVSNNWDRVLQVTGGFTLLLVGLILLGRALGVGGRRLGGDLANRLQYGPQVVRASGRPTRVVRVHEATDQSARRAARIEPSETEIPF